MDVPDSPSMRKFLEGSRRSESGSDTGQISPSLKLGPQVTVEWSTTVQSPRRSTQEQGMNATATPAPSGPIGHSPHSQPDPHRRQEGSHPPSPSSLPFAPQSPPSEPLSLTIPGAAKISVSPAGGSPKYSLAPPSPHPSGPPPQIAISAHSPHKPQLQSPTHSLPPDASPPAVYQSNPLAGSLSPLGSPPSLLYTPQSEVMVFQPNALANASVGSPVGSPQQPSLGSPRQEPEHTVAVNLSEMWSILTETVKRVEHLEARQDGMDRQIVGVQEAEMRLRDLVLTVEELGKVQSARNRALALQNSPLEDELLASRFGAGLEQLRYQIRQLEHDSEGSRLELRTSIRELFRALESSPRAGGGGIGGGIGEGSYSPSKYSGGPPGGPGEMDIASAKKRVMDALQDPGSRGIETHVKPEWDDPNLLTLSKNDVNKLNRLVDRVNTVEERLRQSRGDERRSQADGRYASTVDRHALERAVTEEMGRRMGEMRREWEKWAEALKVGIDSRISDALDPDKASGGIFK